MGDSGNGKPGKSSMYSRRARHGLAASRPPDGSGHIIANVRELRRTLREAVEQRFGTDPPPWTEMLVNTACREEQRAQLAARWLRVGEREGKLSWELRVRMLELIGNATAARNKAAAALGLEVSSDPLDAIYGPASTDWPVGGLDGPAEGPEAEADPEADPGPQRAGAGRPAAGTADDQPTEGRADDR